MTKTIIIICGILVVAGLSLSFDLISSAFVYTLPGLTRILSIALLVGSVVGAIVGIVSLFKSGATLTAKIIVTILILAVLGVELGFSISWLVAG